MIKTPAVNYETLYANLPNNILNWPQVSPGLDCVFAQDAVAINMEEKHCCVLGELNKRATIIPDVDDMLANMPVL